MTMQESDRSMLRPFPQVSSWQLIDQAIEFGLLPKIMGIVNVTPDSFSDGGAFYGKEAAVRHALQLLDEGADILDVGGESTRPYSTPVEAAEELARVIDVVREIKKLRPAAIVSIDTSKAIVAREAVAAGAQIINDVTAATGDADMPRVMADSGAGVVLMHMQGTPQTMQDDPHYDNVVIEVREYLQLRRDTLRGAGVPLEKICLDPGIGFGKSHQHNLDLMAAVHQLHPLDCPILVGHSRKGFLGRLIGDRVADRTWATVGSALAVAAQGAQIIRVHDVRALREALVAFAACGGIDGRPGVIPPAAP